MIKVFRFDNDYNEFSANTYVVGEKGHPCVVIDLGSTQQRIIDYIKQNHSSCSGILLTHGHFDHIRGIENFLKTFTCTTFIDNSDDELLDNPRLNGSASLKIGKIQVKVTNKYLLDDEDEINFGNGLLFKVIETPFHTSGSVCFLYEKENAIFTGDTLFKNSIGRTDLPTGNERLVKNSLEKLKKLDQSIKVYPGHGDETTLKREFENNPYLK